MLKDAETLQITATKKEERNHTHTHARAKELFFPLTSLQKKFFEHKLWRSLGMETLLYICL